MNDTETPRTAPTDPSSLPVQETGVPDLVQNVNGTTFDIYLHFSQTSKETFTDKLIRLIRNAPPM